MALPLLLAQLAPLAMQGAGMVMQHRSQQKAQQDAARRAAMANLQNQLGRGGAGGGPAGQGASLSAQMLNNPALQEQIQAALMRLTDQPAKPYAKLLAPREGAFGMDDISNVLDQSRNLATPSGKFGNFRQ